MDELVRLHETANGPVYLLETDTVICESLRATGYYAAEEKALLGQLLSESGTVIDVGANVGNHTLFFANAWTLKAECLRLNLSACCFKYYARTLCWVVIKTFGHIV